MDLNYIRKKLHKKEHSIIGIENFGKYAVLLPIIEKDNEIHLLFEVRSFQLRSQPGEICFPGGRIEKEDEKPLNTAIRETTEELGIEEKDIKFIAPLDLLINPFGKIIYPFVGTITEPQLISPNKGEVAEVFTVPLSFLQSVEPEIYHLHFQIEPERDFPFHHIIGGKNYNWQKRTLDEHFYYYEDKVIWGLTARILTHFLETLKK